MSNLRKSGASLGCVSVFAFLCAFGCDPVNEPEPDLSALVQQGRDCDARIYLLRGLWDFFSLGLNDLATQLQFLGPSATAISGPDWPTVGDEILTQSADGTLQRPLVLVGHSYGADEVILLAKELESSGITVDLLILIDATDPRPIPANVSEALHLYLPSELGNEYPNLFAGNPVVAEEGNQVTRIVNRAINEENFGPEALDINHFNIEASAAIHREIAEQVIAYCTNGTLSYE